MSGARAAGPGVCGHGLLCTRPACRERPAALTRAALRALVGRGATIRRRPSFGPRDRAAVAHEPTMAPTRGLTPALGGGAGRKTFVWCEPEWVAWAVWDDARDRVPVVWVSAAWWATAGGWPAACQRSVAA